MGAGRPRKPTALKILSGNPGRRPLNEMEPKPTKGKPSPPKWLTKDGAQAFDELSEILDSMQILTIADGPALVLLCDAWAEYKRARDIVIKNGFNYETVGRNGLQIKLRPEVAIASDAWRRIKSMMVEFGLTPSSRSKLKVGENDIPEDPLGDLLSIK